jgi:hypothetical protein
MDIQSTAFELFAPFSNTLHIHYPNFVHGCELAMKQVSPKKFIHTADFVT